MLPLDPKHTDCFLTAVRTGTIRGAADHLGLEPSTVSRNITALETRLATALLERGRSGVQPTQSGALLVTYLRQQSGELEALFSRFDAIRDMKRGSVTVAVGEGFVGDLCSTALKRFAGDFPQITYHLDVGSTDWVADQILSGQSHIGLAYNAAPDPRLNIMAQAAQPLVMLAAPDTPYAATTAPLAAADLARFPCAILHRGYGIGAMLAAAESGSGIRLKAVMETGSIAVLKAFARNGLGVTFLPEFVVAREIADGLLVARPTTVTGFDLGRATLSVKSGRSLPVAAQTLARYLAKDMSAFTRRCCI